MIKKLSLAVTLLILSLTALTANVAAGPFSAVCGNGGSGSAVCNSTSPTTDPLTGPNGTLIKIANIVAYAGGAAAIIVIIVSALRLITSGSDVSTGSRTDTDVEDARRSLAGAAIGLTVIVLGRLLVVYILSQI